MSKRMPKLRFKEFSGEWEEKIGDFMQFLIILLYKIYYDYINRTLQAYAFSMLKERGR